jgi:hypothetical protein
MGRIWHFPCQFEVFPVYFVYKRELIKNRLEDVMNLPNSNVRGFFEIIMPGIFLVFNAVLTAYFATAVISPEMRQIVETTLTYIANPVAASLLIVVFGYPTGVVLRLLKTARIDSLSANYIRILHPKLKNESYLTDDFFYSKWMLEKCNTRMPAGAAQFYKEYWADKDTGNQTVNTSFFNFCKLIVSKHDPQSGTEIFAAEALDRFLAGSFYALEVSIFLMFVNTLIAYTKLSMLAAFLPAAITITYYLLIHVILSQFRYLRCKEVETVFNACFANWEHFEKLLPTHASRQLAKNHQNLEYGVRRDLIREAWGERSTENGLVQSLSLDDLISFMKKESQRSPFLSSLYFAGTNVDHPYFLENTKIAIGISVLPEDSLKAGLKKRHPHQTEIILVLQGQLCVHFEDDGKITEKSLLENEHFIIHTGICHWITSIDSKDAVFIFIKTNPSQEPKSQSCSEINMGVPTPDTERMEEIENPGVFMGE